jgi:hypothetical protein
MLESSIYILIIEIIFYSTGQFENKLWVGQIYGVITLDGKQVNPRLIFILLMGLLEQFMHFNGLYQMWPDIIHICNSLAIYCLVVQLIVRLGSKFIRHDDENMVRLLKTIVSFYEQAEQTQEYITVLFYHLDVCEFLMNSYMAFCLAIYCIPNPTAWIVSWYSRERTLFTPIFFPFIDPQSLAGFIVNSVLLTYYTLFGYFCFMTVDVFAVYFVYQCVPMSEIYCMKLKAFGEKFVQVKNKKMKKMAFLHPSTSNKNLLRQQWEKKQLKLIAETEKHLIVLIKDFNTYNDFVYSAFSFMELTSFAALSLNSMAIAMSIVVLLYFSIAIGVFIVIILLFQVLMPCVLGTMISHQKEKVLHELWSFPWYELSNSKQKMFLQLIHLCQNSNELKVPIINRLNMELFTTVINGVYSYFMFLWKMFKIQ